MSWTNKVTWSEGLFIRPQLFQQQERYLEWFAHRRTAALTPFFWGFSQIDIDADALSLGKLVLARCAGLYPDGTPFEAPGQAALPAPLTLSEEHLGQRIHLALPIRAPNTEETTFDDTLGSQARFRVVDAELRDSNSNGQGARLVQLAQLRLALVPEKELTSAWMGLPVARVRALHADGSVELDAAFIPPINRYGASPQLAKWFSDLHGLARMRADTLARALGGTSAAGAAQAAEVGDFLQLQILNRYEPLMAHLLLQRETGPETLYLLLRTLAGELATFSRDSQRRPAPVPDYSHGDPQRSFRELVDVTRALLNALLLRGAEPLPLTARGNGMHLSSIDPQTLAGFRSLVLAVAANMPLDQLASQFIAQGKAAPADRLPELVRLHLPGIGLKKLPVAPRQFPYSANHVYFELEAAGPLWDHLQIHGGLGLHVAQNFPGLQMQLWGLR